MTYGVKLGLFAGSGPTIVPEYDPAIASSTRAYVAWHRLDPSRRLELVEKALAKPENDNEPDGFPVAL